MAYYWSTPIKDPKKPSGRVLEEGTYDLEQEEVPESWFQGENQKNLKWGESKLRLPDDPDKLLLGLRKQDLPYFPGKKPSKSDKNCKSYEANENPTSNFKTTLMIEDSASRAQVAGGPNSTPLIGYGDVRTSLQIGTQQPGFFLQCKSDTKGRSTVWRLNLHGNTSMESVSYFSPQDLQKNTLKIRIPEENLAAAKAGKLRAVRIVFPREFKQRLSHSLNFLFNGKDDRWSSVEDMLATIRSENTKGFDRFAQMIADMKGASLTFFRECVSDNKDFLTYADAQYRYWVRVMTLAIRHGPWWFYAMQQGFNRAIAGRYFDHWIFTLKYPPPVPFWLVKKYTCVVKRNHNNQLELLKLAPLEWKNDLLPDPANVGQNFNWCITSPDELSLVHELSIARERAWETKYLEYIFVEGILHNVKLSIVQKDPVMIRAEVTMNQEKQMEHEAESTTGVKIVPASGNILKFRFKGADQRHSSLLNFKGTVVEVNDKPATCDFVTYTYGATESRELIVQCAARSGRGFWPGTAEIQLSPDYQSSDRIITGFKGVNRNFSAREIEEYRPRPDPRSIFLQHLDRFQGTLMSRSELQEKVKKFGYATIRQQWVRSIDSLGFDTSFEKTLDWFGFQGLNQSQQKAIVVSIMGGDNNLSIVHGPPATGKSHTLGAMVTVLCAALKSKVVVSTPSIQAADAITEKLIECVARLQARNIKINLIRLLTIRGTPIDFSKDAADHVPWEGFLADTSKMTESQKIQRSNWRSGSKYAHFTYFEHIKRAATEMAKGRGYTDDLHAHGRTWVSLIDEKLNNQLHGDKLKQFKQADINIGAHVMGKECDILVGTLSSMGRTDVVDPFPADTIVIDEAAQAQLGELCIPFATFSRTVKRAVLAGDDLQLSGRLQSSSANEVGLFTGNSVFRDLRLRKKFAVNLLREQYRCHPDIYSFSNRELYENLVRAAPANSITSGLDHTIAKFLWDNLERAQDQYGDKVMPIDRSSEKWPRVIAIDIDAQSQVWPGSVSACNEEETNFAVWLHNSLIEVVPPNNGEPLKEVHVTMISPYRGEVAQLKAECKGKQNIWTVAKSQGGECDVGISVFAKNLREKGKQGHSGLFADQPTLNVWLTRQKRVHFMIGNFRARLQAYSRLVQMTSGQRLYRNFLNRVCNRRGTGKNIDGWVCIGPEQFRNWKCKRYQTGGTMPNEASRKGKSPADIELDAQKSEERRKFLRTEGKTTMTGQTGAPGVRSSPAPISMSNRDPGNVAQSLITGAPAPPSGQSSQSTPAPQSSSQSSAGGQRPNQATPPSARNPSEIDDLVESFRGMSIGKKQQLGRGKK